MFIKKVEGLSLTILRKQQKIYRKKNKKFIYLKYNAMQKNCKSPNPIFDIIL